MLWKRRGRGELMNLFQIRGMLLWWALFLVVGVGWAGQDQKPKETLVDIINNVKDKSITTASQKPKFKSKRIFKIKKVLDGKWTRSKIEFSFDGKNSGIPVLAVDAYSPSPMRTNPKTIQVILAFQLAQGKTREDFAEFKKVDASWVASNHGSNFATIWTGSKGEWNFDAFEDIVFASKADFDRAYAGNEELNKAAKGLFGEKVLVVIVEEE
jgi:hypothetical protein